MTKYRDAEDLIGNCKIEEGCMIWQYRNPLWFPGSGVSPPTALISPNNPLAKMLNTNSVARILFTLCRFVPASSRLVKRCTTPFCVNPFHHTESRAVLQQRKVQMHKGRDPNALLPSQESRLHLILNLPKGVTLASLAPKDPEILGVLMLSASISGFDGKGIHKSMLRDFDVPQADSRKPVLTIRARPVEKSAVPDEGPEESMDDFFAGIERSLTARGIGVKT